MNSFNDKSLLFCPFCGASPKAENQGLGWKIVCACGIQTPDFYVDAIGAAVFWDTRANTDFLVINQLPTVGGTLKGYDGLGWVKGFQVTRQIKDQQWVRITFIDRDGDEFDQEVICIQPQAEAIAK